MAPKGIVIQINGDGASAARALELVDQHLRETASEGKTSASEISEAMDMIKRQMEFVGIDFALYEVIGKMKELVTSTLDYGEVIERASAKTGLSAESLSVLHYIAQTTGGDFDTMSNAVGKMDRTIGEATEGNKAAERAMQSLGLNARQLAADPRGAEIAFHAFAEKLSSLPSTIQQVTLASDVLGGKIGAEQIPILIDAGLHWDEYKKKASDAGVLLNGETAESLEKMNEKLKDVKESILGCAMAFTEGLTPGLTSLWNAIGSGSTPIEAMKSFGQMVATGAKDATSAVYELVAATDALDAAGLAATGDMSGAATFWKMASDADAKAMKAFTSDTQAQMDDAVKLITDTLFGPAKAPAAKGGGGGGGTTKAAKSRESQTMRDWIEQAKQDAEESKKIHDTLEKTWEGFQQEDDAKPAQAQEAQLGALRIAAQLEEQTNTSIQARLALLQTENALTLQKVATEQGINSQAYQQQLQLNSIAEAKLKIADIDRQIRAAEAQGQLAVGAQRDREDKDPTQRKAATAEINALNKQTAATLKDLVAQYDALAATLGGDFIEKARALHAEMDKLNTPDKGKGNEELGKSLADGMESMAERMAEATGKGRQSFHSMAKSIEQDLVQLAMKLAMQKWLTPILTSAFGGAGGGSSSSGSSGADAALESLLSNGHAGGGDMDSPGVVGEEGPEIFFPKGPGTVMPNDVMQNLSKSGGGATPNVTMNITNASSQPVTARQTGTSFDAETKQFIVHTMLEDMASGGPISSAMQQNQG